MLYFSEYVLGWKGKSNLKADKGTIVHKILEILAKIKLAQQKNEDFITDEIIGPVDCANFDIHIICEQVFNYYAMQKNQVWMPVDFKDCEKWVNKVIDFNGGVFNPLNMNIVAPEQHFDIQISEPWATYDYTIAGEHLTGCLALKGTIDLITSPGPGIYEIVDWKTGRRLNWATGEEKTHEKLRKDPQLMIYYLAAKKLYPEIDQIMLTIFFINDGGPFSMCFTEEDVPETLDLLRTKFEHIKGVKTPKLTKSWRCSKFCGQGTSTFEGTPVKPMQEFRSGQVCAKGTVMTKCQQINYEIGRKGMDRVVKEYSAKGHELGTYCNPGEI